MPLIPYFHTGQYLSARQVNTLSSAVANLYDRSLALRTPQPRCAASGAENGGHSKNFYIVHYHNNNIYNAGYEYLYYDIDNLIAGNTNTVNIYYKDMTTPLKSFNTSGRVRGVVALKNKPTAETHPIDEELVLIRVTPSNKAEANQNTIIYEISEIITTPYGYVALNNNTALKAPKYADVATDLQHVADNVTALDLVCRTPVKGMRYARLIHLSRSSGEGSKTETVCTRYLIRNKTGKLYYHIAVGKDTSDRGWVRARIYVNDTEVPVSPIIYYNGAINTKVVNNEWVDDDLEHFDGSVDISSIACNPGQLMKVHVTCETTILDGKGNGHCAVYYLGESL